MKSQSGVTCSYIDYFVGGGHIGNASNIALS